MFFYATIADISNFDIVPDEVKEKVLSLGGKVEEEGSTNILDNMGSMLLYVLAMLILVGFALLLKFLSKRSEL